MRVCVIGAGKAGTEAAREAARCGADVALVDLLGAPLPDWRSWPGLIREGAPKDASTANRRLPPEVTPAYGTRITSVARGSAKSATGRTFRADAFVLATGSGFERVPLQGRSRPGVVVLDTPGSYAGLGREVASAERVVVAGEGGRGMQVAERVASDGRRVTVIPSSWQHGAPGAPAADVLRSALEGMGISVGTCRVDRALGTRRLEAVLAGGEVVPAEALAVVPRRTPGRVPGQAAVGRHGGVRIELDTRTSVPGILSAGGCAELGVGSPPHSTLEDEPGPSGRVAGANATGFSVSLPTARRFSCSAFGLVWARIGEEVAGARAAGFDADAVGERWDERSSCSIVYDRARGTVLGLEVVHEREGAEPALPPMRGPLTLRSLAYECPLGSSDISMVSETARLGLGVWSRS